MKRVLVTGATGFVGRQVVNELQRRGVDVQGVSRTPVDSVIPHHAVDLLDGEQTKALLEKLRPSHLLHLAWYAVPGRYWTSPENLRWLEASLRLARLFRDLGGERLVTAGTCAEYDWAHPHCSELKTPTAPRTLYGHCKLALSDVLEQWAKQTGISVAVGRLFFLYGPHEYPERLVASVIRSLLRRERARCSVGTQARDFLYVEDVARAFVDLLASAVTGPVNIGSGQGVTVRELASKIGQLMGAEELLSFERPLSADEPAVLTADVGRLTQEVGWQPRFDLEQGLDRTIAWWQTQATSGVSP